MSSAWSQCSTSDNHGPHPPPARKRQSPADQHGRRGSFTTFRDFVPILVPIEGSRNELSPYASGRNRTFNLGIKSPLLCQLSYGRKNAHLKKRGSSREPLFHPRRPTDSAMRRNLREWEGERGDLNPRPPEPQSGALTN
jgi:hypothetical protein